MSDFGLSEALDEADQVKLVRAQQALAERYGEHAAAARATAWLVENGHETPRTVQS